MAKRILLECTPTFSTDMITGIQRVVRNLVHYASKDTSNPDVQVMPVIFQGKQLYQIPSDTFDQHINGLDQQHEQHSLLARFLFSLNKHAAFAAVKDSLRGRFYPLLSFFKRLYVSILVRLRARSSNLQALKPQHQDTLVFIDVSWGQHYWNEIATFRSQGVNIVFVLYDLIPVNYKHFYGTQIAEEFDSFVANMLVHADKILCISKAVKDDLLVYIKNNEVSKNTKLPQLDYFHLGVNARAKHKEQAIRSSLKTLYAEHNSASFLMLSTIEPRKNHNYLLDAFEVLWQGGNPARLVIVGRIGQLAEAFMKRIENHPELNSRLFIFHDLDDAEVNFCYKHADALVFPSFAEGFGLPVIEALQNQLPVIASDIPVHREIGKDRLMYIDPCKPASLVERVEQITQTGVEERYIPKDFHWMNWQESTQMFLRKVQEVQA